MSAAPQEAPALVKLFYDETLDLMDGGEVTRHKRDGFEVPGEVWTAQAEAIGARILRVLDAAVTAEVKAILADNEQACLHKVAHGIDLAVASIQQYVETSEKLLIMLHARLEAAQSAEEKEDDNGPV